MSYPDRIIHAPTELAGCELWFDAQDLASITKDGANKVSQWADKSGNAKHATQPGADALKPTYDATAFGGYPCLDWGAGDTLTRRLTTPSITLGLFTMFLVLRGDASSGVVCCHAGDGTCYMFSTHNWSLRVQRSGAYADRNVSVSWLRDSVRHVVAWRFGGGGGGAGVYASSTVRLDGVEQGLVDTAAKSNPGTATVSGAFYVGNQQTPNSPFRGLIAEVIVFSRDLSDGERASVERYLAKKWALAPVRDIAAPTELPGCALWLDAADLLSITKDGANLVSQWNDKSASANHFAQATGSMRPVYQAAGGPAGKPTILFDGVDDRLDAIANISLPTGMSIFALVQLVAMPASRSPIFACAQWLFQAGANNWVFALNGSAGDAYGFSLADQGFKAISSVNTTTWATLRMDSNTASGFVSGANARTTTSLGQDPLVPLRIANIKLCELIVFNRQVTDGERVLVERYLEKKYNVGRGRFVTSPLEIQGCILWLDAAQVTLTGGAVSQWDDLSGANNHLTQITPGARPVVGVGPNGLACLTFDGVDDILNVTVSIPQPHTIFLVAKSNDPASLGTIFCGGGNVSRFWRANATTWNFAGAPANQLAAIANPGPDTWCAFTFVFDGVSSSFGQNSSARMRGNMGVASAVGVGVGGLTGFGSPHYGSCSVAEVLVFNRALTDGERFLVEQYLAAKYAL